MRRVDAPQTRVRRQVFQRLADANLTVKATKCFMARHSVEMLGHTIDKSGQRPQREKVEVILARPRPTTITGLRSVLGAISFYRRYIPNCAAIMKPLHQLDSQENPRVDKQWGPAHDYAFDYLKRALASRPLLIQPDYAPGAGGLVMQTDASDVGLSEWERYLARPRIPQLDEWPR